jgi:acyl carrier protein
MSVVDHRLGPEIRAFIANKLLYGADEFPYSDDASLLDEGIIDSLGVMELVEFASSHFGVVIAPDEVTLANFDSVNKLADFVVGKLKSLSSALSK